MVAGTDVKQRLIDANALNGKYRLMYDAETGNQVMAIADFTIDAQPTIEAEPVRHGSWIDEGQTDDFFPHHSWRCSECGEQVLEIGVPWYKRCPECGARMDKK